MTPFLTFCFWYAFSETDHLYGTFNGRRIFGAGKYRKDQDPVFYSNAALCEVFVFSGFGCLVGKGEIIAGRCCPF